MPLKATRLEIPEVVLIEPVVHRDERGFFVETYREAEYAAAGVGPVFVQDNHSSSRQGTLRGMHSQRQRPQGKLVRAIEGEVFDVAVDVRRGSPTFGRWVGVTLSSSNFLQLYVPPGFLHGFYVLTPGAQIEYKCTEYYVAGSEVGIAWNDPRIDIRWPLLGPPLLSPKDAALPRLEAVEHLLPRYEL